MGTEHSGVQLYHSFVKKNISLILLKANIKLITRIPPPFCRHFCLLCLLCRHVDKLDKVDKMLTKSTKMLTKSTKLKC